ncbi:DUF6572 domain-containing protein [Asticcacaulis sp. AC460]|uniref:DUF6572 domain-containing protein n=1 Tax=Asticcacaulis sp. AC460 TaxID=1282360 RepID=UPI0012DC595A|nr:DUF6572 domain-containing protein [Asticcacaulis sp. AC460]
MTVENVDIIDFISLDNECGDVVLTISDHLEWGGDHIIILQEKINTYLSFIESGQIFFSYPLAKGKKITIEVVHKYPPDEIGLSFFRSAAPIISSAGMSLRHRNL